MADDTGRNGTGDADRAPPHNLEAEAAVLGLALMSPATAEALCGQLAAADFHLPRHRAVFEAMHAAAIDGAAVDPVTVWDALLRLGLADVAGGAGFSAALMLTVPTAPEATAYVGILKRLTVQRREHEAAQLIASAAHGGGDGELVRVMREQLAALEVRRPLVGRRLGASYGAPADREWIIDGWLPVGTVTLLHGRGGAGKSALALMLACAIAGDGTHWPDGEHGLRVTGERSPVVLATFEDSADEFERRRLALARRKYLPATEDRIGDRVHALDLADRGPLWSLDRFGPVDDADASGLDSLAAYASEHAARLVVIDPLYAAFGGSEIDRSHVGAFLTRLRRVAAELRAAILIVSHPAKGSAGANRELAGEDPSGSSTWRDGVRAAWRLAPESMPGNNGDGEKVDALTLTKSNYGRAHPAVEPVFLESPDWPLYRALNPRVAPASSGRAGANGDAADAGDDAAMLGVGGI